MKIKVVEGEFCVCKIRDLAQINFADEFLFAAKTDREISLVCRPRSAPGETQAREDGWKAFRIEGALDFSLVGILARIATVLAHERISIFAVSTYDTDYILVKKAQLAAALAALEEHGYRLA